LEACGEAITIPEGLYLGEYLKPVGQAIKGKYGDALKDKKDLSELKPFVLEQMMEMIRADLADLGIAHEVFVSEKTIQASGKIEQAVTELTEKGLVYRGILEPPKGKQPEDWEPREQLLFKSSNYGDDIDRPLQKSDGSWTYFAPDIAYHLDKLQRGFNHMVLVLGADHGGYMKRLKAAVAALSDDQADIDIKLCQLVNFLDGGKPVKMSKRAGTFKTVKDVVDSVGADVVRFIMLTRKNDAVLDFDLTKVTEQSTENPIFYVQYAHARASSVLRHAKKDAAEAFASIEQADFSCLAAPEELALIKCLAEWPRQVESAALAHEPHRIAFYVQEVAASFHHLWNKGKEDAILRFIIVDDVAKTSARLAMIQAMMHVIASALTIFNIKPVNEM